MKTSDQEESMSNDKKLVKRIKKKSDREAANLLVERYYREIFAYVYRQTVEEELTKDLTQDIFYNMLRGIHSYDYKKAEFRTWLYHIASNRITDYYRSRTYKNAILTIELDETTKAISDDFVPSLLKKETVREVMDTLAKLDSTLIQIFQMKWFENRTFAEISEILQIHESTVKTRYYQTIRTLRKEIKLDE